MWIPWRDTLRFALPGVLFLVAAYSVSEAVDPVYSEVHRRMEIFRERREEVEVVAVGNSHSLAIDFGVLGMPGFHLWQSGNDVFETAYFALHAAPQAPRLRYVLVSVSFASLRLDNTAVVSLDQTGRRREMYARTRSLRWIPGDGRHFVAGKVAPVVRPDHWLGVVARALGMQAEAVRVGRDGAIPMIPRPLPSPDSLTRHAAARLAQSAALTGESLRRTPDLVARTTAELDRLARTLAKRGVQVVLYTPPYFHAFVDGQDPAMVEEARRELEAFERRHANAVWLDYSTHPEFTHRPEYLRDSDHLNAAGARVFSALLRECLRALPERPRACGSPPGERFARRSPSSHGPLTRRAAGPIPAALPAVRRAPRTGISGESAPGEVEVGGKVRSAGGS